MIREPFCWLSLAGLEKVNALPPRDRKATKLVYLALAEMAAEQMDGTHEGFTARAADVVEASSLCRETVYEVRDRLIKMGLLEVSGAGYSKVWKLLNVSAQTTQSVGGDDTIAHARETAGKKEEMALLTESLATEPVADVFSHWQRVMPFKGGCRLTPGRREKIRARLRSFSVADLCEAIDVAAADPFLNGENDRGKAFNDFKTIFRSDEKVEELLEQGRHPKVTAISSRRRGAPEFGAFLRAAGVT